MYGPPPENSSARGPHGRPPLSCAQHHRHDAHLTGTMPLWFQRAALIETLYKHKYTTHTRPVSRVTTSHADRSPLPLPHLSPQHTLTIHPTQGTSHNTSSHVDRHPPCNSPHHGIHTKQSHLPQDITAARGLFRGPQPTVSGALCGCRGAGHTLLTLVGCRLTYQSACAGFSGPGATFADFFCFAEALAVSSRALRRSARDVYPRRAAQ